MTHTITKQPETLRIAQELDREFGFFYEAAAAITELRRLHARVQELEASQAQRVPLTPYTLREIIKKLNDDDDEGGWNFGDLAREVEIYHGITQEKLG